MYVVYVYVYVAMMPEVGASPHVQGCSLGLGP